MRINRYLLNSGKLQKQPSPASSAITASDQRGESWFDIEEPDPAGVRSALSLLELHPLILDRCVDLKNVPGVISYGQAVLLEFPADSGSEAEGQDYLTIVLLPLVLVTIRHGALPTVNDLALRLAEEKAPDLNHLGQLLYLILDELTDLSVQAETEIRDQIQRMAKALTDNPAAIRVGQITGLRWEAEKLVALVENQLYCISSLNASDNESLNEPHRKAYLQDLQSEVEIAQRGAYRLEGRVDDLFSVYQGAGNERLERRLRTLTIISAITLPLGLMAGLLGMNVGGLPGTKLSFGFALVVGLMVLIALAESWFFKKKGWFD